MRVIRYSSGPGSAELAAVTDAGQLYALPFADLMELVCEADRLGMTALQLVYKQIEGKPPLAGQMDDLQLLVPIVAPEVWAAGVTYERSRVARNYEATGGRIDVLR